MHAKKAAGASPVSDPQEATLERHVAALRAAQSMVNELGNIERAKRALYALTLLNSDSLRVARTNIFDDPTWPYRAASAGTAREPGPTPEFREAALSISTAEIASATLGSNPQDAAAEPRLDDLRVAQRMAVEPGGIDRAHRVLLALELLTSDSLHVAHASMTDDPPWPW